MNLFLADEFFAPMMSASDIRNGCVLHPLDPSMINTETVGTTRAAELSIIKAGH
jgi:hypothetical protein